MAGISVLPEDVLLHIMGYLDTVDRISFVYSCSMFRQMCLEGRNLTRKVDLARYVMRKQEGAIKNFLRDKHMTQYIRELNLNNRRVINWQRDVDLIEEFIITLCPHLETLHVLNCGISLKTMHRILQHAPKLTTLSFSIMDLSPEDIEYIVQDMEYANGICLENIQKLHLEIPLSTMHIQILKYLVLSRCKCLEELEIYVWGLSFTLQFQASSSLVTDWVFLHQQAIASTEPLQHFHSLTVQTGDYIPASWDSIKLDLADFVVAVARKKSRKTNWKKLFISPPIDIINLLDEENLDELNSVEAFSESTSFKVNELQTLFRNINGSVVRKLQLEKLNLKVLNKFRECIERIGGSSLQSLSLSFYFIFWETDLDANLTFKTMFSVCANIRELDLLGWHFQKNICESLSQLKHLVKIQLPHCAIAPDHPIEQQIEKNGKLLSLVENCRGVTEFHVRGCKVKKLNLSSRFIVDYDLLPIAKWAKLESLTCVGIGFSTQQHSKEVETAHQKEHTNTFLQAVVENCRFLKMLRISIEEYDKESAFTFLESARFLKHLAIEVRKVDLGSGNFWKLLSRATNLERLCIKSWHNGPLNVADAVKMVKNLPQLHVFHLHFFFEAGNAESFRIHIKKALEEKSNRISSFEFVMQKEGFVSERCWTQQKVLPFNISELCYLMPIMSLPSVT